MTFNGWLQIAIYCVLLVLITKPIGGYMTRVFNGDRTLLSPVLGPIERGLYRVSGVDETQEQHWVDLRGRHAGVQLRRFRRAVRVAAAAGGAAVQSAGPDRGVARSGVQHLGQLSHQHQLAVLRAGNHV